jgi:hypothetical protein
MSAPEVRHSNATTALTAFGHLAPSVLIGEFVANIPALGWNSPSVLELSLAGPRFAASVK